MAHALLDNNIGKHCHHHRRKQKGEIDNNNGNNNFVNDFVDLLFDKKTKHKRDKSNCIKSDKQLKKEQQKRYKRKKHHSDSSSSSSSSTPESSESSSSSRDHSSSSDSSGAGGGGHHRHHRHSRVSGSMPASSGLTGNDKSVQSHYSARLGDSKKVDVFDVDVSRTMYRSIQRRSVSEKAYIPLPGNPAKVLKTKNKFVRERDRDARVGQEAMVQVIRTLNSTAEHLVSDDKTGVAVRVVDASVVAAKALTAFNKTWIKLKHGEKTLEIIANDDSEELMRESHKKRLHERAKQATEARSVASETQGFWAGGGRSSVVDVAAFLPAAALVSDVVAVASAAVVSRAASGGADAALAGAKAAVDSTTTTTTTTEGAGAKVGATTSNRGSSSAVFSLDFYRNESSDFPVCSSSSSSFTSSSSTSRSSSSAFLLL
jgi:hypothetical protein